MEWSKFILFVCFSCVFSLSCGGLKPPEGEEALEGSSAKTDTSTTETADTGTDTNSDVNEENRCWITDTETSQNQTCFSMQCEDGSSPTECVQEKDEKTETCTTKRVYDCAFIFCPDGTTSRACDGEDGEDGTDGRDGSHCSTSRTDQTCVVECPDGTQTTWHCPERSDSGVVDTGVEDTGVDTAVADAEVDTGIDVGMDTSDTTSDTADTFSGDVGSDASDSSNPDTAADTSDSSSDTGGGDTSDSGDTTVQLTLRFSGTDNSVLEIDSSEVQLNDGTSLSSVKSVCAIAWAPGESFNHKEVSISDADSDGWIEYPLPSVPSGDEPYSSSCKSDGDLPLRLQFRRCSSDKSKAKHYLDLSNQKKFGKFFWVGVDDGCQCTQSLSVSWDGTRYYATTASNHTCP